jgi:hypothetical protein
MSDSHGYKDSMLDVVALESPELILHLGDHDRDCADIGFEYPEIPLRTVRGNCDRSSAGLDMDEFTHGGIRFFMTHGHNYNVKMGKSKIVSAAASRGVDIVLFGHTHIPHYSITDNITIVNPGSIGDSGKSYAVLEIKNGAVSCALKRL